MMEWSKQFILMEQRWYKLPNIKNKKMGYISLGF